MYSLAVQGLYQSITSQIPDTVNIIAKKRKKKKLPSKNSLVHKTFHQNTINTLKLHREFEWFFGVCFPGFWSTLVLLKKATENHSHTKCIQATLTYFEEPPPTWYSGVQGNRASWLGAPKAVEADLVTEEEYLPSVTVQTYLSQKAANKCQKE